MTEMAATAGRNGRKMNTSYSRGSLDPPVEDGRHHQTDQDGYGDADQQHQVVAERQPEEILVASGHQFPEVAQTDELAGAEPGPAAQAIDDDLDHRVPDHEPDYYQCRQEPSRQRQRPTQARDALPMPGTDSRAAARAHTATTNH